MGQGASDIKPTPRSRLTGVTIELPDYALAGFKKRAAGAMMHCNAMDGCPIIFTRSVKWSRFNPDAVSA
jgi:hypothetical protein